MRLGVIGDMHLGDDTLGIQWAFLRRAIEQMKADGVTTVLNVGDMVAFGKLPAFEDCCRLLSAFDHYFVLGNAEIRDADTRDIFVSRSMHPCFEMAGRKIVGLNTPAGEIDPKERETLDGLADGDIVFLHHGIGALKAESRAYMQALMERVALVIVHGHEHKEMEYTAGKSRVIGIRGLDPDKAIGDWPTLTYLDVTAEDVSVEQKPITLPREVAEDLRRYMGLSCVDNVRDVSYATENGVKYIELRFNGKWPVEPQLAELIKTWREKTDGFLSVHMPALQFREGRLEKAERFFEALEVAKSLGVNHLTVHVPTVRLSEMDKGSEAWQTLLDAYAEMVRRVDDGVTIGIENLHMKKGESEFDRDFGYAPSEVEAWIDAINEALGAPDRVGHVLDVGHARNNGILASKHPISRWYEQMGRRTAAYHIHQTIREGNELKNHCPLTDWFGPMISYASFLYAWQEKTVNHVPVFLEVKGCDNFEISVRAFREQFGL